MHISLNSQLDENKMKINKKNLSYILKTNDIKELDTDFLLECFLVAEATKISEDMSDNLYFEMKRRNICFSKFYNFAKFHLPNPYLIMLCSNTSNATNAFVNTFNKYNIKYSDKSAPKQKGKVVCRLYSIFHRCYDFKDISIEKAENLLSIIEINYDLFRGHRDASNNDLTRNDLYGLATFFETIYAFHDKSPPKEYFKIIIPNSLIKDRGLRIARNKTYIQHTQIDDYKFLIDIYKNFINTLILKSQKEQNAALYILIDYVNKTLEIEKITDKEDLKKLLLKDRHGEFRFLFYLEKNSKNNIRSKAIFIRDMMLWAMNEYNLKNEDIFEPLFSNYEWDRIQRNKVYKKNSTSQKDETPKAVIPMRVHQLAIEILSDPDYKWSRTLEDQYFINEKDKKIFNPTLTNLLALIFFVPIRTIQAQVLDSGEGDLYRYDFNKLCWIKNDNIHGGYWKSVHSVNPDRGFLKRDQSLVNDALYAARQNGSEIPIVRQAYMYINTNKTADRSVGYSDVSGYTIPWHHDDAFAIYNRQLKFITKHHEIKKPSSIKNLRTPEAILGGKPTYAVLQIIPDRFYLFRCNLNSDIEHKDFPPTKNLITKMWNHLMLEIQKRLEAEGSDFSIISPQKKEKFTRNIGGRNSYISYLTPHCTRVTGITRLEEHGVPIDIISKLIAGHANVRTTYRYTKHEQTYINNRISEAQARINEKLELSLTNDLKSSKLDKAIKIAYIPETYQNSWNSICERSWNSNSLGICPNSGTLCQEGHIQSDIEFNGVGKCLNCKYLISGKPYLINIWSHINMLLYRAKELNDEYSILQNDYKNSIKQRATEFKENKYSEKWSRLNSLIHKIDNKMEMNTNAVNLILTEIYYGNHLFEIVRNLTNNDEDFVDGLKFEECSNFEHLNSIVESESYLPYFQRNSDLKFKRDTFVDQFLMAIGEKPIFLRNLSQEEKEETITSIAKMIEHDVKVQEGKFIGTSLNLEYLMESSHDK
ncbi:tyrosine-type recombinase/integrase [Acinetobacter pittii]|uniref:VPA1269 family protein n=1 Tax=Acinetobacter pittii TaxID=48296 RepID=UPI001C233F0B|nr:VPA1269 family protein [Acinetobacter pittii]QXA09275.1 tyrosine-type recombinase/integrase [Acinetobacter pittii]